MFPNIFYFSVYYFEFMHRGKYKYPYATTWAKAVNLMGMPIKCTCNVLYIVECPRVWEKAGSASVTWRVPHKWVDSGGKTLMLECQTKCRHTTKDNTEPEKWWMKCRNKCSSHKLMPPIVLQSWNENAKIFFLGDTKAGYFGWIHGVAEKHLMMLGTFQEGNEMGKTFPKTSALR